MREILERLGRIPRGTYVLLAIGIAAALAVVAITLGDLDRERRLRVAEAERHLALGSLAIAAQVERDVQAVRLVLAYAREVAGRHDLMKPGVGQAAFPALQGLAHGLPMVGNLLIINREGVVVASNLAADQAAVNAADRAYFRFHRDNTIMDVRVGEANVSRTLGARVVHITQRINGPGGEFAGVVLVSLRHDYFAGIFRNLAPPDEGSAVLFSTDGRLLARYPVPPPEAFERTYGELPLFTQYLPAGPQGNYLVSRSGFDGEPRYIAYRVVEGLPLVVAVTQSESAVLAPWGKERPHKLGMAALGVLILGVLLAIIVVQGNRREEQSRALAASDVRFRTLFDYAADAIFVLLPDATVVAANAQAARVLEMPAADVVGRPFGDFLAQPDASELRQALELVHPAHVHTLEGSLRNRRGTDLPVEIRFSRVDWGGDSLLLGLARDVSERRAYQQQLERLASLDELTQLPKRALLLDRLEQALAMGRRRGTQVGILFLDVDRFKEINDTLGHAAGDELLQQAAFRMLGVLRQVDTVGRFGGDEFVILLPEISDTDAIETVANKLCTVFQEPFNLHGASATVSASIGIAIYPRDGDRAEALVRRADEAMYAAKLAGRNRVRRCLVA